MCICFDLADMFKLHERVFAFLGPEGRHSKGRPETIGFVPC